MAILSILGLYDYDPTIFDGLQLPTAADITDEADKVADPWIPNKQAFIEYLCMECAELELVYPSAPTLSKMISVWSRARQPVWKALYNTLLYKYNPIWNKDGIVSETHTGTGSDLLTRNLTGNELETRDLTGSDNETRNLQTVDSGTSSSTSSGTTAHNVTGFDSNAYSPDTQDTTSGTTQGTTGNTRTETGTDNRAITDAGTINRARMDGGTEKTDRNTSATVNRIERGNIGVTMTQEMIQRQRDVVMFNLYDVIVQEFKTRFCLMLY